jgi:biopolymer transport protein ExbB
MTKKIIKLAFCLSLIMGPVAGFAQEAAPTEEVAADNVQKTTLWQMIKQGGWAMWPLGLMSMGMVYFIVQNGLGLREKVLLRPDMIPEFIALMKDKKIVEAHSLCKENETLFTYVFQAGLERCSEKREVNFAKVKEAIDEASTEEITSYMKPIDYLSIIGATAPMLGLLGTVSGMIKAFQTIGSKGMGKPEELAGNIGEALVTTATGLLIAIPSMLSYYYFRNSFIKSTATLGRNIGGLLDTLETGELPLGYENAGE